MLQQGCEVAVIGGGPAGSVAALVLARAGLNVVLVDAGSSENRRSRGETLSPTAAPILTRLQLAERVGLERMPDVTGFTSLWGSSEAVSRPGFVVPDAATVNIDRSIFDSALRGAAAERGATLLHGRVSALTRERQGWRLICRSGKFVDARVVIDASGRGGRFVRRLGAHLLVFDKMIALTAVFGPNPEDRDRTVSIESAASGWLFTTLDAIGCRIVSFFTDRDLWPSSELTRPDVVLDRILASSEIFASYANGNPRPAVRVWSAGTLALSRAAARGVLAVGDAAQTRDPLSSQGIGAAMEDAEAAASLLAKHFEGDQELAVEMHEHDRRQRFVRYLRERCLYYRAETRWPTNPFWVRRHDREEMERSVRVLGRRLG